MQVKELKGRNMSNYEKLALERIDYGTIGTELEIIRKRYFVDYTSKSEKHFSEEYTLYCISDNKLGVDNIFLKIPSILPSLRVFDSDGEELPLITNKLLDALLATQISEAKEDHVRERLSQLRQDIKQKKYFVLWIKLPPTKKMRNGEAKVISLEYEAKREALKEKTHVQELRSENYEVFYVIKPPEDYEISNTDFLIYDENGTELKRHEKVWKNEKGDPIYFDDEHNLISIRVRPEIEDEIYFSYSFKPHESILKLPHITLWFLIGASVLLALPKFFGITKDTVIDCGSMILCFDMSKILNKQIEVSVGIIGASLIIAGLIHNQDIRDSIKWKFFIPIAISIFAIVLKI